MFAQLQTLLAAPPPPVVLPPPPPPPSSSATSSSSSSLQVPSLPPMTPLSFPPVPHNPEDLTDYSLGVPDENVYRNPITGQVFHYRAETNQWIPVSSSATASASASSASSIASTIPPPPPQLPTNQRTPVAPRTPVVRTVQTPNLSPLTGTPYFTGVPDTPLQAPILLQMTQHTPFGFPERHFAVK